MVAADPGCSTEADRTARSMTAGARSVRSRGRWGHRPVGRSSWSPSARSTFPHGCSKVDMGVGLERGQMAGAAVDSTAAYCAVGRTTRVYWIECQMQLKGLCLAQGHIRQEEDRPLGASNLRMPKRVERSWTLEASSQHHQVLAARLRQQRL